MAIAGALKLPLGQVEMDVPPEVEDPESIGFIEDFMTYWILLHEDVRMISDEVSESIGLVIKGKLDRVDWGGVICSMVKRELMLPRDGESGNCYNAWHFQRLIRFHDDDDDVGDVIGPDGMHEPEDHHSSGLLLELGKGGSDEVGHVECEEVEPPYCLVSGRNGYGEHSLQPCNQNRMREMAFKSERRPPQLLEEENYDPCMKYQENCVQCDGAAKLHCNPPPICIPDHSAEEPRTDTFANVGNTFMSSNSLKRRLVHGDEMDQLCHSQLNKKMRHDISSDKARMAEQACRTAEANEKVLLETLEKQQSMIEQSERTKNEEIRKRDVEISRLTCELHVMEGLLNGYRSALKETQRLFSEYRNCHGLPEEPLYRDFVRTGGVVPGTAELKKQGLPREEMESDVEVL